MFDKALQTFSSSGCRVRKENRRWLSKSCLSMPCLEWRGDTKCSLTIVCVCVTCFPQLKASLVRHPAPHIVLLIFLFRKSHRYIQCPLLRSHKHTGFFFTALWKASCCIFASTFFSEWENNMMPEGLTYVIIWNNICSETSLAHIIISSELCLTCLTLTIADLCV